MKATKLVQWGVIGCKCSFPCLVGLARECITVLTGGLVVLVYALLFMEWDDKGSPFDEVSLSLSISPVWNNRLL